MGSFNSRSISAHASSTWRLQHTPLDISPVYSLVSLNMGGELIDALHSNHHGPAVGTPSSAHHGSDQDTVEAPSSDQHGSASSGQRSVPEAILSQVEIPETARQKVNGSLYNGGERGMVTEQSYREWYSVLESYVNKQDPSIRTLFHRSRSEYEEDAFNHYEQHEACTKLTERGWMGETAFLLCLIMNTPEHIAVARALLKLYPKMVLDVYESREFFGESALHIAVANGDLPLVKLLVGLNYRQQILHKTATGRFFRPEDQKDNPKGVTNYKGEAYLGEYPLSFAASKGDIAIYDFLLEHGADPNLQDSFGNTVLHMAVIHDQLEMFRHAVNPPKGLRAASLNKENHQKLTPLTLASKLGRERMFRLILNLGSVESWRFGDVECRLYPLATLDSVRPNGGTDWQSALWYIVKGDSDGHLNMLEGAVVKQLLREKWTYYAMRSFIKHLVWAVVHLLLLTIAVYLRPEGDQLLTYNGWRDGLRFCCELLVCVSCLVKIVLELSSRDISIIKNCTRAPAQTVYLISCLLILLCVPFRATRLDVVEDVLLMFAVPGAWFFLLFFASGFVLTGPFVVMIYKMITGDLFKFGVIYSIFFVSFSTAFFFLFRDVSSSAEEVQKYFTVGALALNLFQMTLGELQYEALASSHYPVLAKLVFGVFMILMSVLLLQMLIAMMANTYSTVISRAKKEWRRQWATTVLVLEHGSIRQKSWLNENQAKYSKELNKTSLPQYPYCVLPSDNPRALMVISSQKDEEEEEHADERTTRWRSNLRHFSRDALNRSTRTTYL